MDLSKLPKMSNTPPPPPAEQPPEAPAQQAPYQPPAPIYAAPGGPEAWISFAMAGLLLLVNPRLIQYLLSPESFPTKWSFTDPQGAPMAYTQTVFFWSDVAITLFCLALLIDGFIILLARNRVLAIAAFAFTLLTVAGNLAYLVLTLNSYGLAITSAIAVAYGVYIAIFQWRLIGLLGQRG